MLAAVHDSVCQQMVPIAIGQLDRLAVLMIHEPHRSDRGRAKLFPRIAYRDGGLKTGSIFIQRPDAKPFAFVSEFAGHDVGRAVSGAIKRHWRLTPCIGQVDDRLPVLSTIFRTPDPDCVIQPGGCIGD